MIVFPGMIIGDITFLYKYLHFLLVSKKKPNPNKKDGFIYTAVVAK